MLSNDLDRTFKASFLDRELYDFMLRTGFLLNKLNFDITILTERFESQRFKPYSNVFKILNFVNRHKEIISYFEKDKFKIRELKEDIVCDCEDIDVLNTYFVLKRDKRIRFFSVNHNFFAQVQNLVFQIPFPHGIWELNESFLRNDYADFNVKDSLVIDVGAFIGDSAIYFASKGAKKVIAFEPAYSLFSLAQKNIQNNGFQNKISLRNQAIWVTEGEKEFSFITNAPGSSAMIPLNKRGPYKQCTVQTTTLNRVIKEEGSVDLLKMDCEGAEYWILPTLQREMDLGKINNIQVEVHGEPQKILRLLKTSRFKIIRQTVHNDGAYLISASKIP